MIETIPPLVTPSEFHWYSVLARQWKSSSGGAVTTRQFLRTKEEDTCDGLRYLWSTLASYNTDCLQHNMRLETGVTSRVYLELLSECLL